MVAQIAPSDKHLPAENSRRSFDTLADYAAYQGAPESAFVAAGWQIRPVMHRDRPALEYRTATGPRWRFIDGDKPKYDSPNGYERCWYGLQRAVAIAQQTGQPLIIANGEAGVVVGQYHGIAATAITGGEMGTIPPALLDTLKAAYPSGRIIVAQDCDETGRKAGPKLARALCDAGYEASAADLQLPDKGDLADFCRLHGNMAGELLPTLPTLALPEPTPIFTARESREAAHTGTLVWEDERRLWWVDVVLPAVERAATHRRRKHFRCINPAHPDQHPSARISTDKDKDGLYVCTCGTHSREAVGEWLGLDFMTWWMDNRASLYQRPTRPDGNMSQFADLLQDATAAWDALPNILQNFAEGLMNSSNLDTVPDPPKVYTPLNRSVTPDPELRLITPSAAAHDHLPTEGELQTANHALYGTGPAIYWILRTADRPFWTRALIVEEAQRRGLPLTADHVDNWFKREGEYFSVSLNIELVKEYYVQNYGKVPNGRLPEHFRLRDLSECPANLFTLAQKRLKEQAVKAARADAQDDDANDPIWWDDDLAGAIADDLDISPSEGEILKNRVNTHYTRQRAENEDFRKRINRAYRKFKRPEQELADKLKASDFADFEIPDYLRGADDTPLNIYYAAFLKWYADQNPGVKISISKICRLLGISSSARALHIRKLAKLDHSDENATRFVAEIDIPADLPDDERPAYVKRQITQLAKENEARPLRLSVEDYDAAYCEENVRTVAKAANVIYAEFRQAAPLVFKPDLPAPKKQATSAASSSITITPDEPAARRAVEHPYGMEYWPSFRKGQIREAIKSRGWTLDTGQWVDPTGQRWRDDRIALLLAFDMPVSESEIMLSIHHMSEKYDEPEESLPVKVQQTFAEPKPAPVVQNLHNSQPDAWVMNFNVLREPGLFDRRVTA